MAKLLAVLDLIYNLQLESITKTGFALLIVGTIVTLVFLIYVISKVSSVSIYLIDSLLRLLWFTIRTIFPAVIVVFIYHIFVHSRTRQPEQIVTVTKGWLDVLWNVIT